MSSITAAHSNDAVRSVMHACLVALDPGDNLRAAATQLRRHDIGAAPVVEQGRLLGVLSERDLVQAIADGQDPDRSHVRPAMTGAPRPIQADDPLWAAAMLMLRCGVRHLPVIDGGRLVGMISIRDALAVIERDRLVEPRTRSEALDD